MILVKNVTQFLELWQIVYNVLPVFIVCNVQQYSYFLIILAVLVHVQPKQVFI